MTTLLTKENAVSVNYQAIVDNLVPAPIHTFLGGKIEHFDAKTMQMRLSYQSRAEFANPMGTLQGGILSAMLDDAMGVFAFVGHDAQPAATINMTVNFLRPTALKQVDVEVYFVRRGRKISNLEAIATQEGKQVGKVSAVFTVV